MLKDYCPKCFEDMNVEITSMVTLASYEVLLWQKRHEHIFIAGDMWEIWFNLNVDTGERARPREAYHCGECDFEWDRI